MNFGLESEEGDPSVQNLYTIGSGQWRHLLPKTALEAQSFPRKRESIFSMQYFLELARWIPVFAGMTAFTEFR